MEKFMFLFRGSDVYQPGQSPEAVLALKEKLVHWVVGLSERGVHLASEPLQPTGKQITKNKLTDAPFGVGREIIGGCTIVQAEDLSEAIEIAKGCPILETNANIEIRQIQKLEV
jgi:hypothetical protein